MTDLKAPRRREIAPPGGSAGHWLPRVAWAALLYTVVVIVWGAYVRASGSGAGCGSHWPLCNGDVVPVAPTIATLIEYSHRTSSGLALIAVVAVLVFAWRDRGRRHPATVAAAAAVFFMLTEAAVGAGLVLFELVADNATMARAMAMVVHLLNTFLLLAAMTLTAWFASAGAARALHWRGRALPVAMTLLGAIGLLLVGSSGAVAALGDTLFPSGSIADALQADFSTTSHVLLRLRILHPVLAVTVAVGLLLGAPRLAGGSGHSAEARRSARIIQLLAVTQLVAGVANVMLLAPVWLQLLHLLLADAIWIAFVLLAARVFTTGAVRSAVPVRSDGPGLPAGLPRPSA